MPEPPPIQFSSLVDCDDNYTAKLNEKKTKSNPKSSSTETSIEFNPPRTFDHCASFYDPPHRTTYIGLHDGLFEPFTEHLLIGTS